MVLMVWWEGGVVLVSGGAVSTTAADDERLSHTTSHPLFERGAVVLHTNLKI